MENYINKVIQGDCLIKLKELEDNSIDSIVTDPPYELGFMGKSWDNTGIANNPDMWRECFRVLKPGGHLLAFSGTRTYHRMACAIEDAGFEVRDMIEWVYSTGFPKSHNVWKQLKKNCNCGIMDEYERTKKIPKSLMRYMSEADVSQTITNSETEGEVLQSCLSEQSISIEGGLSESSSLSERREESCLEGGNITETNSRELSGNDLCEMSAGVSTNGEERRIHNATQVGDGSTSKQDINKNGSGASQRPQSEKQQTGEPCAFCKQYGAQTIRTFGVGSSLKPAHEPIAFCRKPLEKCLSIAENVLKYGTGGINIDESRVKYDDGTTAEDIKRKYTGSNEGNDSVTNNFGVKEIKMTSESTLLGRFPANFIHDNSEEVRECFPETKSGNLNSGHKRGDGTGNSLMGGGGIITGNYGGDSGNASRFFKSIIYQAKSSKSDRNKGLDCYLTVKYNGSIINNNKTLCKEENMVAVQLLQKVISEQELVSFNIDESGVNIMAQCHKDSLSIILTEINRIIGLKIYNSLMHSLTNESTQVVNSEREVGGSLAENVADLKRWILTTTKGNQELALGASRVVCEMLQLISVEENWKEKTNTHSTVKPIALMEYLIKMVTPKGGIVLDPFAGSGSTLVAAKQNGFQFIGIEMTEEYIPIIEARLSVSSQDLLFN